MGLSASKPNIFAGDWQARRDRWQASLDPRVFWPDLTEQSLKKALEEIAQVTSRALADTGTSTPIRISTSVDQQAIGVAAFLQGMGPLLGHWCAQGIVERDPAVATVLAAHLEHGVQRAARLDREFGPLLDAFEASQVPVTVLKGAHTARYCFPSPGVRPVGDIDVLVHPGQIGAAGRALAAAGFVEEQRTRRPFRSVWIPRGDVQRVHSTELNHVDNPWSVDLHGNLERRYFWGRHAGFGVEALRCTVPLTIAGRSTRGLGQPLLTAFLALHASAGINQLQLIRLVELAMVIGKDRSNGSLSWAELAALLTRTQTVRFVFPAFELTESLVPGRVDHEFLSRLRPFATPRILRVLREIQRSGTYRLNRRSLDDKLMWAKGPWELICNLADLAWPTDDRFSFGDRIRMYQRRAGLLVSGRFRLRSRG
jgi:hypothetical protein